MTVSQYKFPTHGSQTGRWLDSKLNNIWQNIKKNLAVSEEPEIFEKTNYIGKTCWKIYDPVSDRYCQTSSEHDVLVYLEERHHHRSKIEDWNIIDTL